MHPAIVLLVSVALLIVVWLHHLAINSAPFGRLVGSRVVHQFNRTNALIPLDNMGNKKPYQAGRSSAELIIWHRPVDRESRPTFIVVQTWASREGMLAGPSEPRACA